MSNFWTTIFGTLCVHFPLERFFYSDRPWDSRFVFRESMWWAVHTLIAIWIKNDGDFRWFLLLWCSWHLNPSCIKESETNIIEQINKNCSLNVIWSNVFCNENMKLRKTQRKKRTSPDNLYSHQMVMCIFLVLIMYQMIS